MLLVSASGHRERNAIYFLPLASLSRLVGMAKYPKPAGYDGGPDGKIMRQGTGGRLGMNPHLKSSDDAADFDLRRNELSCDEAHLGDEY